MSLDSGLMIRKRGDMIQIPKRAIHKVTNVGNEDLIILELQIGEEANEEDIVRLETINGEI
jgi:mannose-6-phosphate isomerase-like protein (cupin superfamily)